MRRYLIAIAALVGCRGSAPGNAASTAASDDARPAIDPAWPGACLDALERASTAPPDKRIALALAGCRPCGVDWRAAISSRVASEVVAVLDACDLGCERTARSDFYAAYSALDDDQRPTGPWRALGGRCAPVLGTGGGDGRYASGTWFALHQIGRGLNAAPLSDRDRARWRSLRAALWFPLPVIAQRGDEFSVPQTPAAVDPPPVHATITADAVTIGVLPRAIFDDRGLVLAPIAGAPWPGDPVALDGLAAGLDALGSRDVLLIAPMGLDAYRVLEVAARTGGHRALLAVRQLDAMAAARVALVSGPLGRALVLDPGVRRACATRTDGAIAGCVDLPADGAARHALLAELTANHPRIAVGAIVVTIQLSQHSGRRPPPPPITDAAALSALLDELAALGVTDAIAANPDGPWPETTTTPALLRAQLAEGASP